MACAVTGRERRWTEASLSCVRGRPGEAATLHPVGVPMDRHFSWLVRDCRGPAASGCSDSFSSPTSGTEGAGASDPGGVGPGGSGTANGGGGSMGNGTSNGGGGSGGGCNDADGDLVTDCAGDCDDSDPTSYPGAVEA